jgi:hypothetical protein
LLSSQHLTSKLGVLHKQTLLLQLLSVKGSRKYTEHKNQFKKSCGYLQRSVSENVTKFLHAESKGLPMTVLYICGNGSRAEAISVNIQHIFYAHKFGLTDCSKYSFYCPASILNTAKSSCQLVEYKHWQK